MDRSDKKHDLVHVYQGHKTGKLIDTFRQQPYSYAGFDYYRYLGMTYPGFEDLETQKVYILLSQPLAVQKTS
jgi:hypothetical protein